jgi:hypothetical protein
MQTKNITDRATDTESYKVLPLGSNVCSTGSTCLRRSDNPLIPALFACSGCCKPIICNALPFYSLWKGLKCSSFSGGEIGQA